MKHDSWWIVFNVFHDTVLVILDVLKFISLNKSFTQIYICLKLILLVYYCHLVFLIIIFCIKQQQQTNNKKTLKTIHLLSCFVGHPVYSINIRSDLRLRLSKNEIKILMKENIIFWFSLLSFYFILGWRF